MLKAHLESPIGNVPVAPVNSKVLKYRPEIDGLRAIAVIPVILFHAGLKSFSGGFVGVDVFFVISGYLITSLILTENQAGRFSLWRFYERRARRILPALFVIILFCIPFAWFLMLPADIKNFSDSIISVILFCSNILFWHQSDYFATPTELWPLLHTWSLAVEEQYYLLFPLFLLSALAITTKRSLLTLLGILTAFSLAAAHWGSYNNPQAAFYLLPTRAWELFIGALIAVYTLSSANRDVDGIYLRAAQPLSLLGLFLIVYSVFSFNERTPFPSVHALLPTVGTALIILFATQATLVGTLLRSGLLVGAGLISYSAYLWHQPLLSFARIATSESPRGVVLGLILVSTFTLAYLTWRLVEQPFRNKEKIGSKKFAFLIIIFGLSLISLGIYGNMTNGMVTQQAAAAANRLILIDRLTQESSTLVRRGVCHYNDVVNTEGVAEFLDKWDCDTDVEQPQLKHIPLVVAGDSLAADKVMAIKLNGYVPLQIGGDGCPLAPRFMPPYCKSIFERLYELVAHDSYYKYIALANNLKKDELTPDAVQETIEYWKRFNKQIIWFTNMPKFMNYKEIIARASSTNLDMKMAEQSEDIKIIAYLEGQGVHVINSRDVFCSITNHKCDYRADDGKLLLVDKHHLTPDGAKRFGKILLADKLIKSIIDAP